MDKTALASEAETSLPYVYAVDSTLGPQPDFAQWLSNKREEIEARLLVHGALLFRGFCVTTPSAFAVTTEALGWARFDYIDGNSPRTKLASGLYTSTEYSPKYMISLHNEMSYSARWPDRVLFCCIIPAQTGGETPIADSRTILSRLNPRTRDAFTEKGVKYIRNIHGGRGVGPSWQETFETTSTQVLEERVAAAGGRISWREDGGVRIEQVRPATAVHPITGEKVWFNQADQFHPSTLPAAEYDAVMSLYQGCLSDLPQYACFGDGMDIPEGMLADIREVSSRTMAVAPWQPGDLLLADNMLVAHGRMPYTGTRRVLVSMFTYDVGW